MSHVVVRAVIDRQTCLECATLDRRHFPSLAAARVPRHREPDPRGNCRCVVEEAADEAAPPSHLCRCGGESTVIDSRRAGAGMRRRRLCLSCRTRWTTIEVRAFVRGRTDGRGHETVPSSCLPCRHHSALAAVERAMKENL